MNAHTKHLISGLDSLQPSLHLYQADTTLSQTWCPKKHQVDILHNRFQDSELNELIQPVTRKDKTKFRTKYIKLNFLNGLFNMSKIESVFFHSKTPSFMTA
jgi:hypothetical protein